MQGTDMKFLVGFRGCKLPDQIGNRNKRQELNNRIFSVSDKTRGNNKTERTYRTPGEDIYEIALHYRHERRKNRPL